MRIAPDAGSPASHGGVGPLGACPPARPGQGCSGPGVAADPVVLRAPGHGSVRVLVVDDNPVNLAVMSAQLASRGLVATLAADGAEAVARALELAFDLILMDLQMPVLDGLDATAAIRRFETGHARAEVPVLAYSNTLPGAGVLAAHGLNGTLAKPCADHELEDCLVRWCPLYQPAAAAHQRAHQRAQQRTHQSLQSN